MEIIGNAISKWLLDSIGHRVNLIQPRLGKLLPIEQKRILDTTSFEHRQSRHS